MKLFNFFSQKKEDFSTNSGKYKHIFNKIKCGKKELICNFIFVDGEIIDIYNSHTYSF